MAKLIIKKNNTHYVTQLRKKPIIIRYKQNYYKYVWLNIRF